MERLKNKNSNGITLIALIITIIVMLILVGVTITVALNGGLFNTAQEAATNTVRAAEKERLIEIVVASYNVAEGKISSKDELESKIKNSLGFEKDPDKTTETKLVVKGKDTIWQIDLTTAEVKEYEEPSEMDDILADIMKHISDSKKIENSKIGNVDHYQFVEGDLYNYYIPVLELSNIKAMPVLTFKKEPPVRELETIYNLYMPETEDGNYSIGKYNSADCGGIAITEQDFRNDIQELINT